MATAQEQAAQLQAYNAQARALVLQNAVEMRQSIASGVVAGPITAQNAVINIPIRNVGLIKGFMVEISAVATVTSTSTTATLTNFGPANLLSYVNFTDLNNNIRVQTTGWHLNIINSVKSRRVFGCSYVSDTPIKYGNNWTHIIAAANITTTSASVTQTLYMMYYVPLCYSADDLRGAVWGNVVNATMQLQLTANAAAFTTGDPVAAVYNGTANGTLTNFTYNVYQVYLDQLPIDPSSGQPLLPPLDLSTIYELKWTNLSGIVTATDFPIAYPNFRDFVSTTLIYDNGGTFNTGSDVNYIALQSANYTNIWKLDPYLAALYVRQEIGDDMPPGVYYFSHRHKPLATVQYGNFNIVLNANGTVNSGASVYVGFEDLGLVNQVTGAGSLPGG